MRLFFFKQGTDSYKETEPACLNHPGTCTYIHRTKEDDLD